MVYKGIPVWLYELEFGDQTKLEEKCYCPTNTTCLKKGVIDISKCGGGPIIVSTPHFYNCDPGYLQGLRGLRPNYEEHGVYIYFEHVSILELVL